MSLTPGFSSEEIKGYVWEYLDLPQGSKEGWLEGKPFTRAQFRRWRRAFISGDMERGLVPRSSSRVSDMTRRAFDAERALETERARHEKELKAVEVAHAAQLACRDEQIRMLEAGNLALGKAFGLLQQMRDQEPGASSDAESSR